MAPNPVTLKYADLHFLFHPQGVALYQLEGFEVPVGKLQMWNKNQYYEKLDFLFFNLLFIVWILNRSQELLRQSSSSIYTGSLLGMSCSFTLDLNSVTAGS